MRHVHLYLPANCKSAVDISTDINIDVHIDINILTYIDIDCE